MQTLQSSSKASARPTGPPRIFWVAQFIAAVVIGLPLIAYGIYCLRVGSFFVPYGRHRHLLTLQHGAATLAAWACIVGGIGAALHAGLGSIDRIKHAAASAAKFAGAVALLLTIAALLAHAIW